MLRRRRSEILYVGDSRSIPRKLKTVLEEAGYRVSPVKGEQREAGRSTSVGLELTKRTASPDQSGFRDAMTTSAARRQVASLRDLKATTDNRRAKTGRRGSRSATPITLRALRESIGWTQGELARRLSMTQPQLSRAEARQDHLVSTLRKFVEALGGTVEIVAVIEGDRFVLERV